jgi:hypothetical protein
MRRNATPAAITVVTLLLAALLTPAAAAAPPPRQVLYAGPSSYPRLIRLADGVVLASLTSNQGDQGTGVIESSADGGRTFQPLATIADPAAAAGAGICCSALYQLPSPVGALPTGTVLWADSTGFDAPPATRTARQRLWASTDDGRTWRYLSDIAVSPNQYDTWEPSLSVAADGSLVAFYSDETDKPAHDQKLVQVRSTDGIHWSSPRDLVVSDTFVVRPGMANAIRLPDGSYFMTYEVCNNDPVHLCSVYFRRSTDGWNYGNPDDLGTVIRTADGKYARHTPTVVWSPGPGPHGTILMISEMLVEPDGSLAPDDGAALLGNDDGGTGPWYEIPAPVTVPGVLNNGCRNFSPSLLPSPRGDTVLEADTDLSGGTCQAFYASAPLTRP